MLQHYTGFNWQVITDLLSQRCRSCLLLRSEQNRQNSPETSNRNYERIVLGHE